VRFAPLVSLLYAAIARGVLLASLHTWWPLHALPLHAIEVEGLRGGQVRESGALGEESGVVGETQRERSKS